MPAALADINSADAPAPAVAPLPLATFAAAITVNVYERGYDPESNSTKGFAAAVAVAASVDVVVFVGGNRICEGGQGQSGAHCKSEGHDRPLRLANVTHASELRVTSTRMCPCCFGRRPHLYEREIRELSEHHPAIVVIWYGSQQMGAALADALHGAVSLATGRLTLDDGVGAAARRA